MQYTELRGSKRKVSRLGFGAMGLCGCFGRLDEKELIGGVLHSLEKGVTFIAPARGLLSQSGHWTSLRFEKNS